MILEFQHALFTLEVLRVIKCAPTLSSIVFTLKFVVEFFKEFRGASLCIPPFAHAYPLAWWGIHRNLFSNFDFFAKQFIGIPNFQIKIKRMLTC
jgi:hypothetical protein